MSDLQGRRIPGEEGSGRRRWIWIVLGLLLLLLLAVLIPFACQAFGGGSGQQGNGQGAQSDAQEGGRDERNGNKARETAGAQGGTEQSGAPQGDEAQDDGTGKAGAQDGGDDAERSGSGEPEAEASREVSVTRLSVRDQSGSGAAVTVPAATLEGTKGWLAVRADDGGKPGQVLGRAPLRAGANDDVKVQLDRPVASSQRLYATVHAEDPADGTFTFPAGDPTATQGGQAASRPISYTVDDATKNTAADATGGGIQDDELPESGGVPPGVLLAAGTALLLSSAACLSLALRRSATGGS